MVGKWFRAKVLGKLKGVIPEAAEVASQPSRHTGAAAESVGKTVHDGDLGGKDQIERAGSGEPAEGAPAPHDPSSSSRTAFPPGTTEQQVHDTAARLLSDRGAADIAALPVKYGLKVSSKDEDGVDLSFTSERSGTGTTVNGSVFGRREPHGKGPLHDVWGGNLYGMFTWKDPGGGAAPSWSMQLVGNREHIGRGTDRLPEQLAELAPGFDADRVRSAMTDAVKLASEHKGLKRGAGSLAVEATGEQLHVRVWKGVMEANMTPADWVLFDRTIARDDVV